MNVSESTWKIKITLNFFNIKFNKSKNIFLGLAYGCKNGVHVLDKFDANTVSIVSFKKLAFANWVFTYKLVYRKKL